MATPSSAKPSGSGTKLPPPPPLGLLAAKPVAIAPLAALAGKLVTKMWAEASEPPGLPDPAVLLARTAVSLAQIPPVLVNSKEMVSDECVKPSKELMVWLKLPKPSTTPAPPSLHGPGVNPVPAFDPVMLLRVQLVALTLTATLPPSPSK